jgi:hypothetical protein
MRFAFKHFRGQMRLPSDGLMGRRIRGRLTGRQSLKIVTIWGRRESAPRRFEL